MLGVSQMQISRISRQALWKLLTAVSGDAERQGGYPEGEGKSSEAGGRS